MLQLKDDETLIVAGSTHSGEEEAVIAAFRDIASSMPRIRLLIAPRHVERAKDVESMIRAFGLLPVMVSSIDERRATNDERRVFVLDTIGHLNSIYSIASLVFIGGSLIKHGGQNPIEPAILEKAIIFGPHMFNFREVAAALLESGGAVRISSGAELAEKMRLLLSDKALAGKMGSSARKTVLANRGATEKNLDTIKEFL